MKYYIEITWEDWCLLQKFMGWAPTHPQEAKTIDWNNLMPVVERIESIYDDFHGYFGVYISSNCCTIQGTKLRTTSEDFHPAYFAEHYGKTKLGATKSAVVEFIKWHNEQK